MSPDATPLSRSIRAATERPSIARTRRLLDLRQQYYWKGRAPLGYTTAEWDALVRRELARTGRRL